jgi:hypothetical protein
VRRLCFAAAIAAFSVPTQAADLVPFAAMSGTNRALVRAVTDHYTLRRQYGVREFKARGDPFEWLMDHMEACSVLAQKTGMISYRAHRDEQGRVFADNRKGASGFLVLAAATDGKRVYYVEGASRGAFHVHGRGVAVVDFRQKDPDTIAYTGALYVKVDNFVVAALAQLFSVFVRGTVDQYFEHVLEHPIRLSEMATREPKKLTAQIQEMPPDDRALLEPFAKLLTL